MKFEHITEPKRSSRKVRPVMEWAYCLRKNTQGKRIVVYLGEESTIIQAVWGMRGRPDSFTMYESFAISRVMSREEVDAKAESMAIEHFGHVINNGK